MSRRVQICACVTVIGFGLIATRPTPVGAQTTVNPAGASTATPNTAMAGDDKRPTGSLEKYHGLLRASELNGASVYNDQGNAIGTINDMLVGDDGRVQNVVISVGGFLGLGTRYVSVPFTQLQVNRSANIGGATTDPMAMNGAAAPGTAATTGTLAPLASPVTPGLGATVAPGAAAGATTGRAMAPAVAANGGPAAANMAAANPPEPQYFSVVLPGSTKDSLTKMPEFRYRD